jgi:hypothetical protein
MTGVDFREALVKFLTNEIADKILLDKSASNDFVEGAMHSNVNS